MGTPITRMNEQAMRRRSRQRYAAVDMQGSAQVEIRTMLVAGPLPRSAIRSEASFE
jgi:hypothetical protein